MDGLPSRTACISCGRPLEPAGGVDAIEVILKATLLALTQRLGAEFAAQIKVVIEQESETLAQSPHPDDQYDAKLVWMVAQGKLFRDLGV
ncbi:hypothetical protein [Blastomonas sp. RAC04]|jgi:hypothetical protein|uniref:hypothetical protein n=1 Tax=Blastomonas sp. RAC04 TaxID=1842535 RepID=UPI00083CC67A|nr:hypothetical protein [Blastomonas sp. RAC04]